MSWGHSSTLLIGDELVSRFDLLSRAPHKKSLIKVMKKRWSQRDRSTDWPWSVWQDSERKYNGGAYVDAAAVETGACTAFQKMLGRDPDGITIL
ncbi:MAG: hypothetical protein CFH41_01481 [Alphaproteobacteria bacterium MarineAlpha11_Bin1]|nr:MAG: hypothetical protein CFH41_01481 [Alphaproteobacteria bacterium MarineAlpha11_Bin1]